MFKFFKRRNNSESIPKPFPEEWQQILRKRFPLFVRLPEPDQRELENHIQLFLDQKSFEGCGGLELNDEIRISIAAQACLLLLHRKTECYPELKSVLVYPSSYFAEGANVSAAGIVTEQKSHRLGESWQHGTVVLAWDSVLGGASNLTDGQNVVLHEFAHQLDQQDGRADGTPHLPAENFLERRNRYLAWVQVLGREFDLLREKAGKGKKSVMDRYGATNPAEFFAVATESFFEKPRQMNDKHPELYAELRNFYQQDPLTWTS